MDGYPQYRISVLEPVNWALSWVRQVLFSPFDLRKWFVIGFCAWLATLGEGGFNLRAPGGWQESGKDASVEQVIGQVKETIAENAAWLIPVAIIGLVLIVGASLLLLWLRSRGKFMFLYCVARNSAEVAQPWSFFARQGNSLFLFLMLVAVLTFAAMAPFIGGTVFGGVMLNRAGTQPVYLGLVVFCAVMVLGLGVIGSLIAKFTKDFVVPIMYLRQNTTVEAWREFGGMLSANKGKFIVYLLFQIVIGLAIGLIVFAAVLATCCCAGCILAIPYIGTVLFLPVLVFVRSYSAFYLAQYGPEYNVFMTPEAGGEEETPGPSEEPN